jgi:hypothetical protein
LLKIPYERLEDINAVLLNPETRVVGDFRLLWPSTVRPKRSTARPHKQVICHLACCVEAIQPKYLPDLEWLEQQRTECVLISVTDYRRKILG